MKKALIFLLVIPMIGFICSSEDEGPTFHFDTTDVRQKIEAAINGNLQANGTLSGLVDLELPVNPRYNAFSLDSLVIQHKLYLSVLLEYPNPLYSLFAVYDDELNLILLDRSVNGNLFLQKHAFKDFGVYALIEEFYAKELIFLRRLKLYYVAADTTSLALKTFLEYMDPIKNTEQMIDSISAIEVKTIGHDYTMLTGETFSNEHYTFNNLTKRYEGYKYNFDTLVTSYIEEFDHDGAFIHDSLSAIESLQGDNSSPDGVNTPHNKRAGKFVLYLDDNWALRTNEEIAKLMIKPMTGSKFESRKLNSSISIVPLEEKYSAELYVPYTFTYSIEEKITKRYSDLVEVDNKLFQFFEISCGTNVFLVVLEVPVTVFEDNKDLFDYIVHSFSVVCN